LAGAFHQRAAISLFGRCIPSTRRRFWPVHSITAPPFLFVRPAHLIAAPHSLLFAGAFAADPPIWCCCLASASHRRAPFSFVCRCKPPIHRFGVAVWPAHLIATPHSLSFAGAFAADPPVWCCSAWPAHSPPMHQFGVVPFGWRIPRRAATDLALFHLDGAFPADSVSLFVGAFATNPPIWCCSIWLAHPLAGPPLPILVVASPCCATFAYLGWRIPSPIFCKCIPSPFHHRSFWPAHPLTVSPLPT